jgi:hypothetical protein
LLKTGDNPRSSADICRVRQRSADALFPFATDGDGTARTGTWDIGADEVVATNIVALAGVIR